MIIFIVTDDWSSNLILEHKKYLETLQQNVEIISSWQMWSALNDMSDSHAIVFQEESAFASVGELLHFTKKFTKELYDLIVPFICPNRDFSRQKTDTKVFCISKSLAQLCSSNNVPMDDVLTFAKKNGASVQISPELQRCKTKFSK